MVSGLGAHAELLPLAILQERENNRRTSLLSSPSDAHKSPEAKTKMGNKRRRLALSCVTCRRRKVKCDRTEPTCVRCQKGGSNCLYVPYEEDLREDGTTSDGQDRSRRNSWHEDADEWTGLSAAHEPHRSSVELPRKRLTSKHAEIDRLERKIADLEARTRAAESRPKVPLAATVPGYPTPASIVPPEREAGKSLMYDLEQTLLRGKSFKTQYFGPSHPASILTQFIELSNFVKNIMDHFPVLDEVKDCIDRFKQAKTKQGLTEAPYDRESLLALIPGRAATDELVRLYMDTFETTYRVLHVPSFLRQYESFWEAPAESAAEFLVLLILVMATVYCVSSDGPPGFSGRSSVRRETAVRFIGTCEVWLRVQSQKHVTCATCQINILLFIAKRMNCVKIKREWAGAGHLLRMAQAAGLHREPTLLSTKISVFDQEMRRRLWATILEIEVQMSIDRGMPSAVGPQGWDCRPPSNIDDEDFDAPCQELPPAKSLSKYTRTSFLCTAQRSAPMRVELLARINSIKGALQIDEALQYDMSIRQRLDDLPEWMAGQAATNAQLARVLARLQLFEFLILVHQPFATQTLSQSRFFYSRASTRDAAITMLSHYFDLPTPINMCLCLFREDELRAALSLCHDLCTTNESGTTTLMLDKTHATSLIESTVSLLGERVMHLGQGFHSYWILSSALSLVYAKLSPSEPSDTFAQQAADRVVKIHDRIMALQEPGSLTTVGDKLLARASVMSGLESANIEIDPGIPPIDPFVGNGFGFPVENFNLAEVWNLDTFFDF